MYSRFTIGGHKGFCDATENKNIIANLKVPLHLWGKGATKRLGKTQSITTTVTTTITTIANNDANKTTTTAPNTTKTTTVKTTNTIKTTNINTPSQVQLILSLQ
ncbi:hypothetical protein BZA77DRAFT_295069 [Pyronema omphalodes]|nr:hypothetical protein BZA77DRAFT_295069 [Pyronema omphalodes]